MRSAHAPTRSPIHDVWSTDWIPRSHLCYNAGGSPVFPRSHYEQAEKPIPVGCHMGPPTGSGKKPKRIKTAMLHKSRGLLTEIVQAPLWHFFRTRLRTHVDRRWKLDKKVLYCAYRAEQSGNVKGLQVYTMMCKALHAWLKDQHPGLVALQPAKSDGYLRGFELVGEDTGEHAIQDASQWPGERPEQPKHRVGCAGSSKQALTHCSPSTHGKPEAVLTENQQERYPRRKSHEQATRVAASARVKSLNAGLSAAAALAAAITASTSTKM
jgi:hypothetical protein